MVVIKGWNCQEDKMLPLSLSNYIQYLMECGCFEWRFNGKACSSITSSVTQTVKEQFAFSQIKASEHFWKVFSLAWAMGLDKQGAFDSLRLLIANIQNQIAKFPAIP